MMMASGLIGGILVSVEVFVGVVTSVLCSWAVQAIRLSWLSHG